MTTLSWDLVGGNPAPGDCGAFVDLAGDLSDTANKAQEAHRTLTAFTNQCDDSVWRGEAADAFREKLKDFPPKLEKLHDSYSTASGAMAAYGKILADVQPKARTALENAQQAKDEERAQSQYRDQAQSEQASSDPLLGMLAPAPTTPFDQAIDRAQSALEGARKQIGQIRESREAAEKRAVNGLQHATEQGIKNDPWYKKAWEAVDKWVDEHADILRKISGVLKVISAIAGLLSFIPFLAPICGPIALVAGGAALLLDATLAATGNGDWKTLAVDAALMALPGVGKLAKVGLKAARGTKAAKAVARPLGKLRPVVARGKAVLARARRTRGDPIDVATGEMVLSQTDVELPGSLPLLLARSHVSSYREGGWFGPSWSSTLDQRLEIDELGVCFAGPDGVVLVYPMSESEGPVLPEEGPRWPLARTAEGGYTVNNLEADQMLYFAPSEGLVHFPLTAVTSRNGHRIDFDYDAEGTIREVRHSGGYRIAVESSDGLISALNLRDGDGNADVLLVGYGYDEHGHLTEVINSSGVPLRFDYDAAGRIIRWQDRNGAWYRYTFDEDGRCVTTSGSGGCLDGTLVYDRENRVTVATDSLGHSTTFQLNALDQVVGETDPLGNTTVTEWDRYDRLLARTDPLGRTTSYRYDTAGNLVAVIRPDGAEFSAEYNDLRQPVTIVESDMAEWRREYDERGNLIAVTDPVGVRTTYDYDDRGNLVAITDALGHTRHVEADDAGLPVATADPLGAVTRYTRDAFGRVETIIDPVGGITRLGWTVEGKLAWRTLPAGGTEQWTYDGEGNLIRYADEVGHVVRNEIGFFDLPVAQTGPDGARLEFSYDTELRPVAVTNPQGLVWRYSYDAAGNLVGETDFNGRVLTYVHDSAGQLVERTNGAGQMTRFTRDLQGNVTEERSGDAVTTFDYDAGGRIQRAVNNDADLVFERDPLGRVLTETSNCRTVTSSYDALGRRVHRRTPSGAESTWEYDAKDQPVALQVAGRTLRFSYDAAGREVERLLGGSTLHQAWTANHQLRSQTLITSALDAAGPMQTAPEDRLLQHRSYRYRVDGYVSEIDDHLSGTRVCDLDVAGRVTAVHGAAWSERYAYDSAGNITYAEWPAPPRAEASDADAQGERVYAGTLIRRAGNVRYEHDAQGRVLLRQQKLPSAKPRTWQYTWDAADRLVAATTPDGQRWRYRYDPLGRRLSKERLSADGSTPVEQVTFSWDGTVLAEQTQTGGNDDSGRTTVWEWEPGTFRPLSQAERVPLRDAPQEWIDEQFYAIVTDLIGTPTEMVDQDGALAWHRRTTLWGSPVATGPGSASCPLRFSGQYFDPETQLDYNYFRYYDSEVGRYGSNDSLGLAAGPNPQAYVSNPMRWIDPLGLIPCEGFIDPSDVRFTQDSIGPTFRDGRSVSDMSSGLRNGSIDPGDVPAIRLVERNDNLFTLDNRRLVAFGDAGVDIPYRMATRREIAREWTRKFTTKTDGLSIQLRLW